MSLALSFNHYHCVSSVNFDEHAANMYDFISSPNAFQAICIFENDVLVSWKTRCPFQDKIHYTAVLPGMEVSEQIRCLCRKLPFSLPHQICLCRLPALSQTMQCCPKLTIPAPLSVQGEGFPSPFSPFLSLFTHASRRLKALLASKLGEACNCTRCSCWNVEGILLQLSC